MTDDEIVRNFIIPARNFVENQRKMTIAGRIDPTFSRGAGLLAPNGKPSNLKPGQHAQVRTPEFKKWFGDWELAAQATVSRSAKTFDEARVQAKDFQGKPLENQQTKKVAVVSRNVLDKMLSEKAVSKSESAESHAFSVANLDQLFERAVLGWSKPDSEGSPNIIAIHRYFAPVIRNGRMQLVKMTVKETAREDQNNPLYTVEAVEFNEKSPAAQWVDSTVRSDGIDPTSIRSARDVVSLAQRVQDFNPASVSKVIDQNGEPLVVYHGTGGDFNTFDMNYADREENWSFSTSKEVAQTYKPQILSGDKIWVKLQSLDGQARLRFEKQLDKYRDEDGEITEYSAQDFASAANEDEPARWAADLANAIDGNASDFYDGNGPGRIVEAYLSLKNPIERWFGGTNKVQRESIPDGTPDGYIDHDVMDTNNPGSQRLFSTVYHVNSSEQIKSATGNNGQFDGGNPDILFSRSIGDTISSAANSVRDVNLPAGYKVADLILISRWQIRTPDSCRLPFTASSAGHHAPLAKCWDDVQSVQRLPHTPPLTETAVCRYGRAVGCQSSLLSQRWTAHSQDVPPWLQDSARYGSWESGNSASSFLALGSLFSMRYASLTVRSASVYSRRGVC